MNKSIHVCLPAVQIQIQRFILKPLYKSYSLGWEPIQ